MASNYVNMASTDPDVDQFHIENLSKLCRICGKRLKKFAEKYESSYSCVDHKKWLAEKFGIDIENDERFVHPAKFCHSCYHLTHAISPFVWPKHPVGMIEDCVVCSQEQKTKKGGRRKKEKKRGGSLKKPFRQSFRNDLAEKARQVTARVPSLRIPQGEFAERFEHAERKKDNLFCTVCDEVLDRPVETKCMQYVCADCFIERLNICAPQIIPPCPVCNTPIECKDDLKSAPDVFVRMIATGHDFRCRKCKESMPYESCASHQCPSLTANKKPTSERTIADALEELKEGIISPDTAQLGNQYVKHRLRESEDGKTARLAGPGKVKYSLLFETHIHLIYV